MADETPKLEEAAASEADGFDRAHRLLKQQLKERPGFTLGIAVGVGVLIGLLLSGRRR